VSDINPPIPGTPYMGYGTFDALLAARPDLLDSMDCRPGPSNLSEEYSDSLIPEQMRSEEFMTRRRARRERERRAKHAAKDGGR
jgi:hypothetical protein